MNLPSFIATVVLVTASGALFPGPMFFAAVAHGVKSGARGGLFFSVGHTLVEFPLVILLALGLLTVTNQPVVQLSTKVAGGLALLVFGVLQIRGFLKSKVSERDSRGIASRNPILLGLVFTGLNPFFIVWWLTEGGDLILDALRLASLAGVLVMYVSHVWMDYAWLAAVAHLARREVDIIGARGYRALMIVFGGVLIFFGFASLVSVLFKQ